MPKDAVDAAGKAVELCQGSGHVVVGAKALHERGNALVLSEELNGVKNGMKEGVQAFKSSLSVYQDLRMKSMIAHETMATARAMMKCLYKPKSISAMAKESLTIFKELNKSGGAASALELFVEACAKYLDFHSASAEAFDTVMYFRRQEGQDRALARAWGAVTTVHIAEGKPETGIDAISNAVTIANQLQDKALLLKCLKLKGKAQIGNRVFEDASGTLQEARNVCKELSDTMEEAAVLGLIIDLGVSSGDIDRAVEAAEDQREIYRSLGLTRAECGSLLTAATCLGDNTTDSAQVARALTRAKEARALASQAKDAKSEASALVLVAKLNKAIEADDDAIDACNAALEVLTNVGQANKTQGEACSILARSYLSIGLSEEALKCADKAIAFAKGAEDPLCEAETLIMVAEVNYGVAIRQEQDTRKGVNTFHSCASKSWQSAKLAKARCERFKYKELLPKALCAVAEVGVVFDATFAAKCAEEARSISSELDDDLGVATATILHANVLYHKGDNAAAKAMAEKGLVFADEAGSIDLKNDAQDIIRRCTPKAGEKPVAAQEVAAAAATTITDVAAASGTTVAAANQGLDPELVRETVMKIATQSIAADEELEVDTPLMDAGLDSLASVAFRNSLMTELKMQMPAALMFDYPNVRQLTDFITEKSREG
jgi:tetratricopeptide (TPR) repeat protein